MSESRKFTRILHDKRIVRRRLDEGRKRKRKMVKKEKIQGREIVMSSSFEGKENQLII